MHSKTTTPEPARPCGQREQICYTVVDLFSGIGGFSLGLERTGGFKTTAFCEIEPYPRKILRKHWPDVPIFEDVKELHAEDLPCKPDVITGGYPCQPFSVAGKRRGAKDDRHLWPEIMRLIQELDAAGKKPTWCIFENVAGHISMGLDQVLADLEGADYTCWPLVIPACALNAPHRRDRVWIIAHSDIAEIKKCYTHSEPEEERYYPGCDIERVDSNPSCQLFNRPGEIWPAWRNEFADSGDVIADTVYDGSYSSEKNEAKSCRNREENRVFERNNEWTTEPAVCGPDDGIPDRVARLKALGNAVVPQIPEMIGRAILNV